MIIDVITIFPNMFKPVINESIIKRAQEKGVVKIHIHNLRDYSPLAHRKVDAPPYGGGGGMVFRCEPIFNCVEHILGYKIYPKEKVEKNKRIIYFTPQGKVLTQKLTKKFLRYARLILICGRYEGIDYRIRKYLVEEEISVGDYILSGGELAAQVFIDVIVRLLPGAVSRISSVVNESFEQDMLDSPYYTKPAQFRGLKVPQVLLSGDHKKIEEWRYRQSLQMTKKRRPDILKGRKNK